MHLSSLFFLLDKTAWDKPSFLPWLGHLCGDSSPWWCHTSSVAMASVMATSVQVSVARMRAFLKNTLKELILVARSTNFWNGIASTSRSSEGWRVQLHSSLLHTVWAKMSCGSWENSVRSKWLHCQTPQKKNKKQVQLTLPVGKHIKQCCCSRWDCCWSVMEDKPNGFHFIHLFKLESSFVV